jgi:hypothetical protein
MRQALALIPALAIVFSGCLGQGAAPGGGGSFTTAVAPGGAAGPEAGAGVSAADGGSGGGSEGGGPTGASPAPPDEASATPVNVVGVPIAMTPGDLFCLASGANLFFDDLETAVTGRKDAEGRAETLVSARLVWQDGSGPETGLQKGGVLFLYDTAFPEAAPWRLGTGADGCFVQKIYAPPGRVLKLKASVPCCAPEIEAEASVKAAALNVGRLCAPREAETIITIPASTNGHALVGRCSEFIFDFEGP